MVVRPEREAAQLGHLRFPYSVVPGNRGEPRSRRAGDGMHLRAAIGS